MVGSNAPTPAGCRHVRGACNECLILSRAPDCRALSDLSLMLACLPALANALVLPPIVQQAPIVQQTVTASAITAQPLLQESIVFPADPLLPSVLIADKIADIKQELYGERPPGSKPLSAARKQTLQLQLEKEIDRKRVKAEIASVTPAQQRQAMFDAATGNGGGSGLQLNPFSDPGAVGSAGSRGSR